MTTLLQRSTVAVDELEYTADALVGSYAAVRSWAHLDSLADRVAARSWRWLIVQRRHDAGQRFAQCLDTAGEVVIELGALDAATGRHAVWRLHRDDRTGCAPGVESFLAIARDWLSLGVVPGFTATRLPIDGDDAPF